ncbi:GntR family transcriptional regulator [Cytobacillus depressus]|uniref:GntR family transcriptional regulator n=1 Tax=Cytobacillus depressus TaxID=1602942 RepID=A0A6L3V0G8_9BACI|nr:GntR family transcriptional regulator [Cytobacillus depressus]KAB2330466.1 GntR family transcriptional regulator [Cytobacillus depressus]
MNSPHKMKRLSTADFAYEQLKERIIELVLIPSLHIKEEELSQELNISRTPLRQALYRLESEGLTYKHANGRMFIADISIRDVQEVYSVREQLECLIAREVSQNMTEDSLYHLEEKVASMKRAIEVQRSFEVIKLGADFHNVLYGLSTNKTAKRFLSQLHDQIERYRRVGGYKNPDYTPDVPLQEYTNLLQSLKTKDADKVEESMRSHMKRSLVTLEKAVQNFLASRGEER